MSGFAARQSARYAEDMATNALAKKQQHELKSGKNKGKQKGRKSSMPRARKMVFGVKLPKWIVNLNKGVLAEFLMFLASQGFDFFTNCWVLNEAFKVQDALLTAKGNPNITMTNFTVPTFCRGIYWNRETLDNKAAHFQRILYLYCFFMAVTSLVMTLQTMTWLYTLYLSVQKRELGEEGRAVLVKMKLYFLLAASIFQDIPMSSITVELFAQQQGSAGITCWLCRTSGQCADMKALNAKLDASQQVIILNFCAIAVTSLWKGISTFYRWSRFPNCEMFYVRACTSVFAGGLFIIIILTPAMSVLTYRYYTLPGVKVNMVKDLIDRVYIIGVIFWVMVLAAMFCCPLLNLIRVAQ